MSSQTRMIGLLVLFFLLLTACSLSSLTPQQEIIPDTGAESSGPSQVDPNNTQNDSDSDGSSLSCFDADAFVLQADHTLTVNAAETSMTHILKQGGIALVKSNTTNQGDYALDTVAPQNLNYEVLGVVGPCSIEANGTMQFSAQGYCQDGIVYLTINENWQAAQGTMVCDNYPAPFTSPGFGATHTGQFGMGEEFLIVDDPQGYTAMREFLGGDGYHTWTLITDLATVPLVPDEK